MVVLMLGHRLTRLEPGCERRRHGSRSADDVFGLAVIILQSCERAAGIA
jgi:hypothetical protein